MEAHDLGDLVVEDAAEAKRGLGLGPVDHGRADGEHLAIDAGPIHLPKPQGDVVERPRVAPELDPFEAEERRVVRGEAHAVAWAFGRDRLHEGPRVEVGVDVDDHRRAARTSSSPATVASVGRIRVIANRWFSSSLLAQQSLTTMT